MRINADFEQRVVVHSEELDWVDSPMPGVSRRRLDRVGGEVARATTIVRYAAGSKFSSHVHTGGEEFVVLDGVFQDEHGDFPQGSYIRNPPESSHTPGSELGCVIFVKLWQFDLKDRTHVRLDEQSMEPVLSSNNPAVSKVSLFNDSNEEVSIQHWAPNSKITIDPRAGLEALVLEGSFVCERDCLVKHSWIRLPVGDVLSAVAGPLGAKVWIKSNHLDKASQQARLVESMG